MRALWRVAYRTRLADIVAAELARAGRERVGAQEPEKALQRRTEIVAMADGDVEALPHDRHEPQARRIGDRSRGDATIGASGTDGLRDVGTSRARRRHGHEVAHRKPGAMEQREQQ